MHQWAELSEGKSSSVKPYHVYKPLCPPPRFSYVTVTAIRIPVSTWGLVWNHPCADLQNCFDHLIWGRGGAAGRHQNSKWHWTNKKWDPMLSRRHVYAILAGFNLYYLWLVTQTTYFYGLRSDNIQLKSGSKPWFCFFYPWKRFWATSIKTY